MLVRWRNEDVGSRVEATLRELKNEGEMKEKENVKSKRGEGPKGRKRENEKGKKKRRWAVATARRFFKKEIIKADWKREGRL